MLKKSIFPVVLVLLIAATATVIRLRVSGSRAASPEQAAKPVTPEVSSKNETAKPVPVPDAAEPQTAVVPESAEIVPEPPAKPSAQVLAVTEGGEKTVVERKHIAGHDLPAKMNTADYRALKEYLLNPQDGKDGDFRQQEYALRNYIMDALRADKTRLSETVDTLVDVYREKRQGDVLRGYALQDLMLVYTDNPGILPDEKKQQIRETFTDALGNTDGGTVAATALLGLQEVSRIDPSAVPAEQVRNAALKLLESKTAGALSQLTAFQICGELKCKEALPAARETAFDPAADWGARIGAIYALGQLGGTEGLERLLNDSNKNIRNAARSALKVQR